jgi:hypothetical protein
MTFFDWAALIIGAVLIVTGVCAVRRHKTGVPEYSEGKNAVCLGWLWVGLGGVFVTAVIFDISFLKTFIRLFFEAAN